jgi:hypothetical protein
MTRDEARRQGLTRYWGDKPCQRGHTAMRNTNSGACLSCLAGYQRAHRNHLAPGYDVRKVTVHNQDWPAVSELVDALNLARSLVP